MLMDLRTEIDMGSEARRFRTGVEEETGAVDGFGPPEERGGCRDRCFVTTQWSVVDAASQNPSTREEQEALEALCKTYWTPLYEYVRREGYSPDDARDLTQGFFERLVEKKFLAQVDRQRGKFRSFLLASFRHFISDVRDRQRALKRGGGHELVSLEHCESQGLCDVEAFEDATGQRLLERRWALQLLDAVHVRLRNEYAQKGKSARFSLLESFLPGQQDVLSQAEVAGQLCLALGTVKWEVHQLKKRYRTILREELALRLGREDSVEEELMHLIQAVSS